MPRYIDVTFSVRIIPVFQSNSKRNLIKKAAEKSSDRKGIANKENPHQNFVEEEEPPTLAPWPRFLLMPGRIHAPMHREKKNYIPLSGWPRIVDGILYELTNKASSEITRTHRSEGGEKCLSAQQNVLNVLQIHVGCGAGPPR